MTTAIKKDYVFAEKNELVRYLYSNLTNPTQIKVQKTLYLLYAFYGATYGNLCNEEDDEFEGQTYPGELFPAKFQAWKYGPVEHDVYRDEKNGEFDEIEEKPLNESTPESKNIKQFIDSIVSQTDSIDDFSLVDRTHQDNVWLDNYKSGEMFTPINNSEIINEYSERYI